MQTIDYIIKSSEEAEQEIVMQWARIQSGKWPALELLYHTPNGGSRRTREGVKLKRMGVLAGVPDLHLPAPCKGFSSLYIEMKYGDGKLRGEQKGFMKKAARFNALCVVCYTAEDAIEILQRYIDPDAEFQIENLSIMKGGERIGTVK